MLLDPAFQWDVFILRRRITVPTGRTWNSEELAADGVHAVAVASDGVEVLECQAERVDPTLERILGRPARTMETYIQENAGIWARVR